MNVQTRYFQQAEVPPEGISYSLGHSRLLVLIGEGWGQAEDQYSKVAIRRLTGDAFQAVVYEGPPGFAWFFAELLTLPPLQFCPLRIEGPRQRAFHFTINLIALAHERVAEIVAGIEGLACTSSTRSRHSMLSFSPPAQKRMALAAVQRLVPVLETLNRMAMTNWELQRRLVAFAAETVPTLLAQEGVAREPTD